MNDFDFLDNLGIEEQNSKSEFLNSDEVLSTTETSEIIENVEDKNSLNLDEYEQNLIDYANEYLTYEAEMNEIKNNFKDLRRSFAEKGVPVGAINKIIKKVAKDLKASPYDVKNETQIEDSICRNKNLISRINNILVAKTSK